MLTWPRTGFQRASAATGHNSMRTLAFKSLPRRGEPGRSLNTQAREHPGLCGVTCGYLSLPPAANYIEMTHFRYLYHKTHDVDKKQVYETRFDDYQQKCIGMRNKIDNFICDPTNKFQCAEVINKANED